MSTDDKCNLCPSCRTEVERWFNGFIKLMPKHNAMAAATSQVFILVKHAILSGLKSPAFLAELQENEDECDRLEAAERKARR